MESQCETRLELNRRPPKQATRRLSRDDEVRLADDLRTAREAFAKLVLRIPEPWRSRVLPPGDRKGPELGRKWPLARLEACYRRLLDCSHELDAGEIAAFVREAKRLKGDIQRARDELIVSNMGLVVGMARQHLHRPVSLRDLVQEGHIGLMEAVERFDGDRGFRVSSYAVWWIRRAFLRAFVEGTSRVRLPEEAKLTATKLKRVAGELTHLLGRRPTMEEIAKETNVPLERVNRLFDAEREPVSLEGFGKEDDRPGPVATMPDLAAPNPLEAVMQRDLVQKVTEALGELQPRERWILRLRFGIDCDGKHTLSQIAGKCSLSRERIRQIEHVALKKIKAMKVFSF